VATPACKGYEGKKYFVRKASSFGPVQQYSVRVKALWRGYSGGKSTEGESEISFWEGRTIFDIRDDIDLQAIGIWGSNTKFRNYEA
jgi:hypothetical protein